MQFANYFRRSIENRSKVIVIIIVTTTTKTRGANAEVGFQMPIPVLNLPHQFTTKFIKQYYNYLKSITREFQFKVPSLLFKVRVQMILQTLHDGYDR